MYSNLSLAALGLSADFPTTVDLAAKHGFGGLDPDVGHFASLGDEAAIREAAAAVSERGLRWGVAGLPVDLDGAGRRVHGADRGPVGDVGRADRGGHRFGRHLGASDA